MERADAPGYDVSARLLAMLRDPASAPRDPDAIARRYGARPESEWRRIRQREIGVAACWCERVRLGADPEVAPDVLDAYLALGLDHERALFTTPQHHGEARVAAARSAAAPCST